VDLEAEYQRFVAAAYAGQPIGKVQMAAMRDAFFAGALVGAMSDPSEIGAAVAEHVRALQPADPDEN
jgi:hypothetical protein